MRWYVELGGGHDAVNDHDADRRVSWVRGDAGSGGGSNARSTNAAGGSVGKVTGVSGSSFTVSTPTGEKVTVKKTSSTVYDKGTSRSSASAVTKGKTVLVLGKVDSTTITASQRHRGTLYQSVEGVGERDRVQTA